jgi:arsenate reductase
MKLLFVCTHNACRSVLAEVIARELSAGRIISASAGSHPAGRIHPLTLEHLQAAGYPCTGLASQSFDDVAAFEPDAVLTVCDNAANEPCPVWLGASVKSHWGLPDPSHSEGSEAFAAVMATIARRIEALLQHPLDDLEPAALQALLDTTAEIK